MSRRVTGRREDRDGAVAENVMVAVELGHRMVGIKSWRTVRSRPFIFGLLHIEHRLRKQFDIADVIRMGVRNPDALDIGWLDAELFKLSGERLAPFPVRAAVLAL